jgi:hypothetical protein
MMNIEQGTKNFNLIFNINNQPYAISKSLIAVILTYSETGMT